MQRLRIAIEAAQGRHEPIDHVLLSGPPGLGKTTLAQIVAHEMHAGSLVHTSGPALEKVADLVGITTRLEDGDVLFVDEIHRLARQVEEYLYPAMEDLKIDFVLDKGAEASAVRFDIKPFTLIGATTRKALISNPLRDRFGIQIELDFYSVDELAQIIARTAKQIGFEITTDACQELGRRSRGTPRIANRLLRRVRDYVQVRNPKGKADKKQVAEALEIEGVDALGLDELDRRYLRTLMLDYGGGPAGVAALAASMQQEEDTLADVIEPHLLYIGLLVRTPTGRRPTPAAYTHLQIQGERTNGKQHQTR